MIYFTTSFLFPSSPQLFGCQGRQCCLICNKARRVGSQSSYSIIKTNSTEIGTNIPSLYASRRTPGQLPRKSTRDCSRCTMGSFPVTVAAPNVLCQSIYRSLSGKPEGVLRIRRFPAKTRAISKLRTILRALQFEQPDHCTVHDHLPALKSVWLRQKHAAELSNIYGTSNRPHPRPQQHPAGAVLDQPCFVLPSRRL